MKSESEIKRALADYENLPASEMYQKYNLETTREAEGFIKALKWVLDISNAYK